MENSVSRSCKDVRPCQSPSRRVNQPSSFHLLPSLMIPSSFSSSSLFAPHASHLSSHRPSQKPSSLMLVASEALPRYPVDLSLPRTFIFDDGALPLKATSRSKLSGIWQKLIFANVFPSGISCRKMQHCCIKLHQRVCPQTVQNTFC